MANKWNVDCADYLDQTAPLVADHPYQSYVSNFRLPYKKYGRAVSSIEIIDPQWQMYDMIVSAAQFPQTPGRMTGLRTWNRITSPVDITSIDAERMVLLSDPADKPRLKDFAHKLLEISPFSVVAASVLVQTDFDSAQPHLNEWNRQFAHQPIYLAALAQHWCDQNQVEKQIDTLKQRIAAAPDAEVIERLAKIYLDRGDEPGWLSTMLLVLKQPDYRLDHSYAEYLIATHFMESGKFDTARKYADASLADSGSGWAIDCDAMAAELQGDYTTAEAIRKASPNAYGWFQFCKRTGRGDVAAATTKVDAWLDSIDPGQVPVYARYFALTRYLEHRQDQAKQYFQIDMHNSHSCLAAMQLAIICIDQKDDAGRDAALTFAVKSCRTSLFPDHFDFSAYADFAGLVLSSNNRLPTDQEIQALLQTDHPSVSNQAGIWYFQGKLLQLHGDTAGAKKYLRLAVQHPLHSDSYMLACDALHELGETTQLRGPIPE
jgi:tetratricopeptide (TPR) repeat protein